MVEGEGPGFGGISQKELWVPLYQCAHVLRAHSTPPSPGRSELVGEQSPALPCHSPQGRWQPSTLLLILFFLSSWTAGCSCCWFPWRRGAVLLMAAGSHPSQGAPRSSSHRHHTRAARSPKAPNTEANPSPPGVQTPRGTGRAGANSSQSQPEMHSLSKDVTLKPTIKSPSHWIPSQGKGQKKKLQKHRLKSQNMTQI